MGERFSGRGVTPGGRGSAYAPLSITLFRAHGAVGGSTMTKEVGGRRRSQTVITMILLGGSVRTGLSAKRCGTKRIQEREQWAKIT